MSKSEAGLFLFCFDVVFSANDTVHFCVFRNLRFPAQRGWKANDCCNEPAENNKSSKRAFQALVTLINLTYYYCHKVKGKIYSCNTF